MLLNEQFYRVAVPDTNNVYTGLGHAELYAFGMAFANVGHLATHDVEDGNGLVVGVLHNQSKKPLFTVEEKVSMIREVLP